MDKVLAKNLRKTKFTVADYVVFSLMLAISAVIGVYYAITGRKHNTTSEFLMGGRSMKVLPVSLSVLASFMSAITLLGTPAEIYTYGTQYWVIIFGYVFLIPAAAYFYLPIFYNLELTSAYEYLELRFSRLVRTMASLTFSFQMILYMAVVLYAPALALSQVTGIGVWLAVASIGVVCTFYTTVGGIKAVVVTDVFQVLLMFAAMFVVVFKGASDAGGWKEVWKANFDGDRIEFLNFDTNPTTRHTAWSLIIGGYFTWLAVYGVNQAMVQRYMTIPTLKGAQRAIWYNLPGLSLLLTLTSLAGLVIYTRYQHCDPKSAMLIQAPDQLFPLFVVETLSAFPGLPGLFVSGIFSGALSTVSSGVNSLAAVTLEDLVKPYIKPDISELWATRTTKLLALFYGVLAIALVAVAQQLGNVLQAALSLFGMIGGPLLGLFTLGMFFPWSNTQGSIAGLCSGLVVSFWIGFGAFAYKPVYPRLPVSTLGCSPALNLTQDSSIVLLSNSTLEDLDFVANFTRILEENESNLLMKLYSLSYMWYSATGCLVVIVVGLIISFITGASDPKEINPKLICPVFDLLCPYLPEKVRRKLRFDVGSNYKPKIVITPSEVVCDGPKVSTNGMVETGCKAANGALKDLEQNEESGHCTKF